MVIIEENWLKQFVHVLYYTLGYIHHSARKCEHQQKTCNCTNFHEILSSHEVFTFIAHTFKCQYCTEEGSVIAYCEQCKLFLDEHCVSYHKKIKTLLEHPIIYIGGKNIEQKFKCQKCVKGGKAVAFCRQCGFFLDEDCVGYHRKIRVLTDHFIVDLRGGNLTNMKFSVFSPIKYCSNSDHKDELSLFCPSICELICPKCKDTQQIENLTAVSSYCEILDIIHEIKPVLNDLLMFMPTDESNLRGIMSDLLVWIRLGSSFTMDLSKCSPAVQQILSSNLKTYHPELALSYARVSCDLLKSKVIPSLQELKIIRTKYFDNYQFKITPRSDVERLRQESTDCNVTSYILASRRPADECTERPHIEEVVLGAIGETQEMSSLNSLELFGEGNICGGSHDTTAYMCCQKPADAEINGLHEDIAFSETGFHHESFQDINS